MFKKENKYLVEKWEDIDILAEGTKEALLLAVSQIEANRARQGKVPCHKYVVVNEDEPYAEVVWKLIEKQELQKRLDFIKSTYNAPDYYKEKEEIEQRIWELERG